MPPKKATPKEACAVGLVVSAWCTTGTLLALTLLMAGATPHCLPGCSNGFGDKAVAITAITGVVFWFFGNMIACYFMVERKWADVPVAETARRPASPPRAVAMV